MNIEDIFNSYAATLQRYATHLGRDTDRADDLVQETMIRASANLWLLDQLNEFQRRAWLFKVLKNRFLDEERTRTRQSDIMEYISEEDFLPVSSTDNSEILNEQVPERYREILDSHYLQGKPTAEIAAELGVPPATVRSRLFLARKWIRDHQNKIL